MMGATTRDGLVVRHPSLRRRLFLALALLASAAVCLGAVASVAAEQAELGAEARATLSRETGLVAAALDDADDAAGQAASLVPEGARLTLIEPDGTVAFDSEADAASMGNHGDRPEVARALEDGVGVAERESETLGFVSFYQARRLTSGEVVRLSVDRADATARSWQTAALEVGAVVVAIGVAWLASGAIAERLTRPIITMDVDSDDPEPAYVELEPLAARLRRAHEDEGARLATLADAATMRREFTANVTHELKTPLATILMASEMMGEGMCDPSDMGEFAQRIHREAVRMEALVSDLLVLSRLDESERAGDRGVVGASQRLDLSALARDSALRFEGEAQRNHVALEIDGIEDGISMTGSAKLLDLLVGNLVQNAIRYNRDGGWVRLSLGLEGGRPTLVVEDSGMGIPREAQGQVFDRFFRVDASRSRELGGTGLGLSIVKHAARFHGARIALESEVGQGTRVTVTFPESRP